MNNRRIIYLLKNNDMPVGGAAVIYEHVEILHENGYHAFVSLPSLPLKDLYKSRAPVLIQNGNLVWERGDIFVFPEAFPDFMKAFKDVPVKKIMFCQSQYNLPFYIGYQGDFYSEYLVNGLIISSKSIGKFIEEIYGLSNIPRIPCSVDSTIFFPKEKKRQIAYMPRKLGKEAIFIESIFKRLYPEYSYVPWVKIDRVDRVTAAQMMAESEVFLSLSSQESFGLPPLEAMACGCLVSGFHGDGGLEYMNDSNGWWANAGDWRTCVDGLAAAFKQLDQGGEKLNQIKNAMALTVANYSRDKMKEALLKFWEEELKKPFN